jgi:hypothetical protein
LHGGQHRDGPRGQVNLDALHEHFYDSPAIYERVLQCKVGSGSRAAVVRPVVFRCLSSRRWDVVAWQTAAAGEVAETAAFTAWESPSPAAAAPSTSATSRDPSMAYQN